jgi:hypothetical protein
MGVDMGREPIRPKGFSSSVSARIVPRFTLVELAFALSACTPQPPASPVVQIPATPVVVAVADDAGASAIEETGDAAAFAPVPGKVAEPLVDRDRAVLLAQPGDGKELDELPAGRAVTISRESEDWLFIRYERDGREHQGGAHRVNIESEKPSTRRRLAPSPQVPRPAKFEAYFPLP